MVENNLIKLAIITAFSRYSGVFFLLTWKYIVDSGDAYLGSLTILLF